MKKVLFILMFVCAAMAIQAQNVEEYKITKKGFIFKGKEIKMGTKFTSTAFQNKFGKSDKEIFEPGGSFLDYQNGGISIFFSPESRIEGIHFLLNKIKRINLQGIIIEKGDTYYSIRKELEKKKIHFTVIESVHPQSNSSDITLELDYSGYNQFNIMKVKIYFTEDKRKEIRLLQYYAEEI